MAGIGVQIAVMDDANQILLIQREDFEVWGLPGGEVDANETLAEAAIREAHEETGFEVELTRLVGIYTLPAWDVPGINPHIALFAASVIGGSPKAQAGETLDVRFFALADLPEAMIWYHRRRIEDALNGCVGLAVRQNVEWPYVQGVSRKEIYRARDESGLSRAEFFLKWVGQSGESLTQVGEDNSETSK